jgi:GAF domain-containing protein
MAEEDRQRLSPRELLDGGIAALGAGAVCAAFVLAHIPHQPGESTVGSVFQLAYPIGFIVLVLLVVGAATVAAGQSRVAWVALTAAFALLALGSALGAALGMTVAVRILTTIQWPVATLLIAAAICADPGAPDPLAMRRGVAVWIPALACGAGIAVLFAATLTRVDHTATALAAGALLLVMVRGYSELRHEIGTRERTEKSLRVSEAGYRRVADEQAALRRVATLVAAGAPPPDVFAAVAEEVGRVLSVEGAFVVRYESDDTVTILAGRSTSERPLPIGLRTPITAPSLGTVVRDTGRPARIDHYADHPVALQYGVRSSAAAPITVQGRLWGYIGVTSGSEEPPPGTEVCLAAFTEIAATAIANSQAREELRTIADEQAALRRVATLVAEAAPPADVFAAVAEEVGRLIAVDAAAVRRYLADGTAEILAQWSGSGEVIPVALRAHPVRGTVTATVRETRRPARVDRYTGDSGGAAREIGIRSAVGVPITVEGGLWGLIAVVSTSEEPPPPGTEERLAGFTELVATAIANAQAREELRTIADEQAALGRVATLVAQGEAPADVFAAVSEEVGHLLSTDDALVVRFELDESVTIVASWTATGEPLPIGHRRHVEPGDGLTPLVRETGRPARIDSQTRYYSELGVESAVAAPITVEGRIWGVVGVALRGRNPAPPDTEERLAAFTGLVATAIANAQARIELRRYAEEQAALRRVATLVAQGVPPEEVFAAVTEEVGQALGSDFTGMSRYNGDGTATVLGEWTRTDTSPPMAIGERLDLGGQNVTTLVARTGLTARIDDYDATSGTWADAARVWGFRSCVGAPITVEDRPWGVVSVANSGTEILPENTEARLIGFTKMVATAVANAQARVDLRKFADEQAALRRVATLVARGAPPDEVFAAVAEEVGRVLDVDYTATSRYQSNRARLVVGAWARSGTPVVPVGTAELLSGPNVPTSVFESGRPARIDHHDDNAGPAVAAAVAAGVRTSLGVPIRVEDRLWGIMSVYSKGDDPLPADTEDRLARFTELIAAAIANAEAQSALTASRARIVAAADAARRRIERDLHDGAQQRLVSLALRLRAARAAVPPELREVGGELERAVADATARWTNCRTSRGASTRRSWPRAASARPSRRSLATRRSRSISTWVRWGGCPSMSGSARTTSSPRH